MFHAVHVKVKQIKIVYNASLELIYMVANVFQAVLQELIYTQSILNV